MRKNKDVYRNHDCSCDRFKNCAECEEDVPGCWWFKNYSCYEQDGKLPIIEYEYQDRKL